MKTLSYQVNHKSKEFYIHSISYNLAELRKIMEKEKAVGYSIVHVLDKPSKNIKYQPSNLVQD